MTSSRIWITLLCLSLGAGVFGACGGDDEKGKSLFDEDAGDEGSAGSAGTGGSGGMGGGLITGGTGGMAGMAGAGGGSCGDLGQSAECTDCLNSACCNENRACSDSADCTALVMCARQCPVDGGTPDMACLQACLDQAPNEFANYNLLVLCQGTECVSECPFVTP